MCKNIRYRGMKSDLRYMKRAGWILILWILSGQSFAQDSRNIRLLAQWFSEEPVENSRDSRYNDVWGFMWNGEEFAAIGSTTGTHIIHLPLNNAIREVAFIPGDAQGDFVIHRDFAFHNGFLYGVCDQEPSGLQVIDCRQLPDTATLVQATQEFFSTAHNAYVDPYTGKLYISGPSGHAMTVLDVVSDPSNPQLMSHFDLVTYVHDVYVRRDTAYLHAAFQGMWVFDFEDPSNPVLLGNLDDYPDDGYNHSGWLNESGDVYVFADETQGKRLKVCDVTDLTDIQISSMLFSGGASHTIAHNVIVEGDYAYVSYYFDGLQVFDISNPSDPVRYAWYDTYTIDETDFRGAWGIHKGLPSGRILISDRRSGLFVFHMTEEGDFDENVILFPNPGNASPIVQIRKESFRAVEHSAFDSKGRLVDQGRWKNTSDTFWFPVELDRAAPGIYYVHVSIDEGEPVILKYLKTE